MNDRYVYLIINTAPCYGVSGIFATQTEESRPALSC